MYVYEDGTTTLIQVTAPPSAHHQSPATSHLKSSNQAPPSNCFTSMLLNFTLVFGGQNFKTGIIVYIIEIYIKNILKNVKMIDW